MAVTYPVGLSLPLVSGYSQNDAQKTAIIPTEAGSPRVELISSDGYASYRVSWLFNDLEFQVFEGWYKYELEFGSISFDMDLKLGGGLVSHELYFSKEYSAALIGKKWRVSASLWAIRVVGSQNLPSAVGDYYWSLDEAAAPFLNTGLFTTIRDTDFTEFINPSGSVNYSQPSLRLDGSGSSVNAIFSEIGRQTLIHIEPDWSNGITVELLMRPVVFGFNSSQNLTGITCYVWSESGVLFSIQFDNADNPGGAVTPTLIVFNRTDGTILDIIRGSMVIAEGNKYMVMVTFRNSDKTASLWVNDSLQGSISVPESWWIAQASGRDLRTVGNSDKTENIKIGDAFIWKPDGSNTVLTSNPQLAENDIDDIRWHLLEADQAFAERQYNAALVNV